MNGQDDSPSPDSGIVDSLFSISSSTDNLCDKNVDAVESCSSMNIQNEPLSGDCLEAISQSDSNDTAIKVDFEQLKLAEDQTAQQNERDEEKLQFNNEKLLKEIGYNEAYRKLNILLQKSNIYAEVILARMNQEHEKALKKSLKTNAVNNDENAKIEALPARKKSERVATRSSNNNTLIEQIVARKKGRNRKKPQEVLSELFAEEELLAKKAKYEEDVDPCVDQSVVTLSTNNVVFECDMRYFTGGSLRNYQIDGLYWLKTQYEQGINGILADEMGLGKTVQCIALFAHFYAKKVPGPFLVVGPLSTMPNWLSEFARFTPKLPVVLYHGSKEKRAELRKKLKQGYLLDGFRIGPVILTSYEILMNDRAFLVGCSVRYLVIDEGHRVKNNKCKLIEALRYFHCSRLLMTGTPLQNNLAELWSLLNFLLPEVFTDLNWFETFFSFQSAQNLSISDVEEREQQLLSKLHAILKPFLLRRVKSDVELDLPTKREIWVYAPMTSLQLRYYKAALDKCIFELCGKKVKEEDLVIEGKRRSVLRPETMQSVKEPQNSGANCIFEQNLNSGRHSYMLLRKICLHPYLVEYPLTHDGEYKVDDQLLKTSGKLLVFDRLITALIEKKHKMLVFTQFVSLMNILQDYCYYRQLEFCRLEGTMNLEERQEEIERFAKDENVRLFIISTKAGGLGLNLVAADTVIIFDSDWNPQGDLQAQDRCHRIGQNKPVLVYRLICRGTVDEHIVERATKKRRLEKMVIHAGKFQLSAQKSRDVMTREELLGVLRSTDYNQIWEIKDDQQEQGESENKLPLRSTSGQSKKKSKCVFEPSKIISEKDMIKLLNRDENFDSTSDAFKISETIDTAF
uniref:Lymphoid-specific helicase n=1 Tax=Romanomermis culicivorax TaxID=13658 RepID=A0A915HXE0_ROMCU